jgi:hypothetical protein
MSNLEELFPGVEWEWSDGGDLWEITIADAQYLLMPPFQGNKWCIEVCESLECEWGSKSHCLDWLRARIIKIRDELIQVTGQ